MNDRWPLRGRDAELAVLASVVDPVFDGSGETTGVVLLGRSGVGKSRLLHAVLTRAAGRGGRTELVRATRAAASVPLAAMSFLFPDDQPDREHDAFELFRLTAHRLRASGPVLLAVDDAHLLDDASAGLLHHLAAEGCVTVVATVCAGYRVADAVTALWKDELAHSVVVPPLPDGVIDELVRQALPGRVSGVTHARLRQLADGNPLYLRELLNAGVTAGSLRERGGFWQWAEPGGGWRLHELVRARLEAAGPAGREVTELVACGEPVPLAMVENHDGLTAAEQAGLIEVVVNRRRADVRLTHPVYGEVLRSSLPPVLGRAIHRNLLRSLRKTPLRRRDDLLRMATWQLSGGEPADPEVLVPAARQAAARHDLALAERLARRAADTGEPGAVALLGQVLSLRGRHRDGAAPPAGGPPGHAGSGERAHRAGIGGPRAMTLVAESELDEAVAVARPVLSSEEELVDARLFAHAASVTALALLGHTENALLLAGDGQRLMAEHPEEVLLGGTHLKIGRCVALLLRGGLAEARDLAEQEYRNAARTEDRAVTALWAAHRGLVAQVRGDLTLATTSLEEAVALEEHEDRQPLHAVHELILAGCLAMTGDTTGARRWQRRADGLAGDIPRVHAARVELNRAMILAACGDRRRAVESAHRAAELARTGGQLTQEAYALYEAARHGGSHQVAERLNELAARTDSDLTAAFADYAAARARRDGTMLDEVATTFEALGTPLMAAEAAFAAGHAYQRSGRTRHATIANERGRRLAARCPGVRTDILVTAGPAAVRLTDREREIARLAASGMSSNDIATRLDLSVRTVDNRLGHVYAKLGISGRTELGDIFTD